MQSSARGLTDRIRNLRPAAAWPLALVLAVVAVFQNGISAPFLLDDDIIIRDNESIRDLWPLSEVLWPRTEVFTAGRPLLNVSFALNHAIGGTAVRGYHVVNILIHAAAALVLYGIVRRTLLLPCLGSRHAAVAAPLAFAITALWALHPVQTQSVTYISQRAESLGIALAHLGRTSEALVMFEETLREHPEHHGARDNLLALRAALRPRSAESP